MTRAALLLLLVPTTLFEGLRAGAGTFRILLDLPARAAVGPVAFAAFSRATDLSTAGVVFYSIYGIGGFVLTAVTFGVARRSKARAFVQRRLGVACVCSFLVLVATTQAAPLMWKVGSAHEAALLARLLDRFVFWTVLRVGLVDVSFVCVTTALASLGAPVAEQRVETAAVRR